MTTTEEELAKRRTERGQLARRVEGRRSQRFRRPQAVATQALTVLGCLLLALAPVAIWARTLVFDTDRWTAVASPLAGEPAVQDALAARVTDEVATLVQPARLLRDVLPDRADVLAVPLAGALERFIQEQVRTFMATDDFADLWDAAVRRAHEGALRLLEGEAPNVTVRGDEVVLDLVPVVERVLHRILDRVPALPGRDVDLPAVDPDRPSGETVQRLADAFGVEVPEGFGTVVVYDRGRLAAAQEALDRFRRLVVLVVVLALVAPAAALACSPHRRRTALAIAVGAVVGLVLVRRAVVLARDQVLADLDGRAVQDAVARLFERLFDGWFLATGWMVGIGLVVAAVCALAGPSRPARRLRALPSHAAGARRVIADHARGVQAGLALGAVAVLWIADLGWLATLVLVLVVAAAELGVEALRPPPAQPPATG